MLRAADPQDLSSEVDEAAMARLSSLARKRRPVVDVQRCTGCGRCVAACDPHLLSLEVERWNKFAVLHDAHRCTGCSLCARVCPFDAIRMRPIDADGALRDQAA